EHNPLPVGGEEGLDGTISSGYRRSLDLIQVSKIQPLPVTPCCREDEVAAVRRQGNRGSNGTTRIVAIANNIGGLQVEAHTSDFGCGILGTAISLPRNARYDDPTNDQTGQRSR